MKLPWKWSLVEPSMFHVKLMRCLPNPAYDLGVRREEIMEDIRRKWLGTEKEKPEGYLLSLMGSHDIWSRTTPDSAVLTGRLLFLLLVLNTQASIWDPWLSRQSFRELCKWSWSLQQNLISTNHYYIWVPGKLNWRRVKSPGSQI